jgi:hypothetical protein
VIVVCICAQGCVFGEMILGRPMFPGKSEATQFELISRAIGSPNEVPHMQLIDCAAPCEMCSHCQYKY